MQPFNHLTMGRDCIPIIADYLGYNLEKFRQVARRNYCFRVYVDGEGSFLI